METHTQIIKRIGGIRKVAAALNHPRHTTVQGWHDRNRIPVEHWANVIQAASELGFEIAASDLVPAEARAA